MKNVFKLIFVILLFSISANAVSAAEETTDQYFYSDQNLEIVIERSNLTDEQLLIIATELADDTSPDSKASRGLSCSLFGHNYEATSAKKTIHLKYSTQPRCAIETYSIKICSRCNDTVSTLLSTQRVSCCGNN